MPDVYLYSGAANPNDVTLSDPTVLRSSGAVTSTGDVTAVAGAIAGTGLETFSAAGAVTAAAGALAVAGLETFTGTAAVAAPTGALAGAGIETFGAAGTMTADAGAVAGTGAETFNGTVTITAPTGAIDGAQAANVTGTGDVTAAAGVIEGADTPAIAQGGGRLTRRGLVYDTFERVPPLAAVVRIAARAGRSAGLGIMRPAAVVGTGVVEADGARVAARGAIQPPVVASVAPPVRITGAGRVHAPQAVTMGIGRMVAATSVRHPSAIQGRGAVLASMARATAQGLVVARVVAPSVVSVVARVPTISGLGGAVAVVPMVAGQGSVARRPAAPLMVPALPVVAPVLPMSISGAGLVLAPSVRLTGAGRVGAVGVVAFQAPVPVLTLVGAVRAPARAGAGTMTARAQVLATGEVDDDEDLLLLLEVA